MIKNVINSQKLIKNKGGTSHPYYSVINLIATYDKPNKNTTKLVQTYAVNVVGYCIVSDTAKNANRIVKLMTTKIDAANTNILTAVETFLLIFFPP